MTQPFFAPATRTAEVRPTQRPESPEVGRPAKPGLTRHPGEGPLRGTPAPNEGYAFVLARRALVDDSATAPASHHDLVTAVALLAAKRAGADRRAPSARDVEWARGVVATLAGSIAGVGHNYSAQRRLVDSVSLEESPAF